jgi:transketolase
MSITQKRLADAIRVLSMDAVEAAKSGHPGMPMGMADVATALFTGPLKYDASAPDWPDRDRFVLSAGHGSMLLYSLLHLTGYPGMEMDELRRFRQLGAKTAGHPEYGHAPGVEVTTGPLGQGIATAVGLALAEAHLRASFGAELVDHRTWVIASDGDLMEGVSQEAISLAGHLALNRLIVLWDDNAISIDGDIGLSESGDQLKRFEAAGWLAFAIDGHDPEAIAGAFERARAADRPVLIACRTRIGSGAATMEGSHKTHGSPLGAAEIAATRAKLGWDLPPFELPEDVAAAWRAAGARGATDRAAWEARVAALPGDRRAALTSRLASAIDPAALRAVVAAHCAALSAAPKDIATREASGLALEALAPAFPALIGGSADLTGSVNTKVSNTTVLTRDNYAGRYIHYGVREHGMAAAMNGMALHGGVIPYSGTFLVFSDYCRPSIRLAALMGVRSIFVMTHDSIGLGEDGPTHQPIEHLASLRAMPNCQVLRPADPVETAECWEMAMLKADGPSVLSLTRQKTPFVRNDGSPENRSAKGAYVLRPSPAGLEEKAVLIASGSEVGVALAAQGLLAERQIGARVVSMPSWDAFEAQTVDYQEEVLGDDLPKVAIEAGSPFGWEKWVGQEGAVIAMRTFGASAPAPALYRHFGITPEAAVEAVLARL